MVVNGRAVVGDVPSSSAAAAAETLSSLLVCRCRRMMCVGLPLGDVRRIDVSFANWIGTGDDFHGTIHDVRSAVPLCGTNK